MIEIQPIESPEIRIDKDGIWYFRNMEMTRFHIIQYFYKCLHRDRQGRYHIKTDCDDCLIQVDDVPFVIKSVSMQLEDDHNQSRMMILLSDGSCEDLKPETLWIGDNNVMYCLVKQSEHKARFSRQAYYQLAEYVENDTNHDRYYITIGETSYTITVKQTDENGGSNVR